MDKATKMQGGIPVKSIEKTAPAKFIPAGRSVIVPTDPITSVDDAPTYGNGPLDGSTLEQKPTGGNFFLLAALGIGAYLIINK